MKQLRFNFSEREGALNSAESSQNPSPASLPKVVYLSDYNKRQQEKKESELKEKVYDRIIALTKFIPTK
jgi:hypothetical protein